MFAVPEKPGLDLHFFPTSIMLRLTSIQIFVLLSAGLNTLIILCATYYNVSHLRLIHPPLPKQYSKCNKFTYGVNASSHHM